MKRRWPLYTALTVGCLVVGLGWLLRPVGPQLPPELASQLTADKRMRHPFLVGSPPSGTTWEMYVVPVAYSRATEAMAKEKGWRFTRGRFMGAETRAIYRSEDPQHLAAIEIMPGRYEVVDTTKPIVPLASKPGEEYSIVAVASSSHGSLRKSALAWIDRLLGRKPPVLPKGAILVYVPPPSMPKGAAVIYRHSTPSPRASGTP